MKKEYDFTKGERGKFYLTEDEMELPVYLQREIREYYLRQAREQGKELTELINEILKKKMNERS